MPGRLNGTTPPRSVRVERPVQLDRRDLARQDLQRVGHERALVLAHGVHADVHQVVRGDTEADRVGDRRRPRLELPGDLVELAPAQVDLADHLAAGQERRHRIEQLASRPQRPGAHRRQHLVAAEGIEVDAQVLHVDLEVRHGLRPIDEHERAGRVRHLGHLLDRVDGAQRVRDVGERHELWLEPEQDLEHVEAQDAVVGDRDELEVAVDLLDEELPRHEVRVVLHLGQDDLVAPADVPPAPAVGDEVDRLGRVAGEHDLVAVGGVDEPGDASPASARRPRSPARRSCRSRDGRWRCTRRSSRRPRR